MVFFCYDAKSYASGREELVPFEAKCFAWVWTQPEVNPILEAGMTCSTLP
jgi:hypothetical protein